MSFRRTFAVVLVLLVSSRLPAAEKLIVLDDVPRPLTRFKVAADGGRLYFTVDRAREYVVLDADGAVRDRVPAVGGGLANRLIPLPDGRFLACNTHWDGHLAFYRADGSQEKVLVRRGPGAAQLRDDVTAWTSPSGAAVDVERRRIFVLDTTEAPRGKPDPDWSRIAVFDFAGKYLSDLQRYDGAAADKDDARRTWYNDIEVDPRRERVYVLARRTQEVLGFGYDGKLLGRAPAPGCADGSGGLAVLPDGRIAVGAVFTVHLYTPDFERAGQLKVPAGVSVRYTGIQDVESDSAGRLYASVGDPGVLFLRWSADLGSCEVVTPRHRRLSVAFPTQPAEVAGTPLDIGVTIDGRPRPDPAGPWQVWTRPGDGSDLRWRALPAEYRQGMLRVTPPAGLHGLHDLAVRYGDGPMAGGARPDELVLQTTLALRPQGERSVAVLTSDGRRAFRAGESIPLHVVRRAPGPDPAEVQLTLMHDGTPLGSTRLRVADSSAVAVPAAATRRLVHGRYVIQPSAEGHIAYPLAVDLVPAEPDSPMQRILYHEFEQNPATSQQPGLATVAERLGFLRDYTRAVARLGFTRETDRLAGMLDPREHPVGWGRRGYATALNDAGSAPPEYYALPDASESWETDQYLDLAVRHGLRYDTQLLPHCAGVRFREPWLSEQAAMLQRTTQWLGRYPSFYGVNYNDEFLFGGTPLWTKEDEDDLKKLRREKFANRPAAEAMLSAVGQVYDRFNAAVRQANPSARRTATPMWQHPATEGSYAPLVYQGMTESYSHYLSERYHVPWYPAHSADQLRRPGLPLMGVFENGDHSGYHGEDGELYLKNVMQVAARGVQGVGVQHVRPFERARSASAYQVANLLMKQYGPVFAECPPLPEAALLYSYTQDVTEQRATLGTPHWERVYAVYGAGLMAGLPMAIVYEEDLAAGWLLDGKRPRVPLLVLAGQTQPLPANVQKAVAQFTAAGGKVYADADSKAPFAAKLNLRTQGIAAALADGYGGDATYPLAQPHFERLAADLAPLKPLRRFPCDSDDPWLSKNHLDGGAVRYLAVAAETSPYPWDAGAVWSLGTQYDGTWMPRTVNLTFPLSGVVYDVFEHTRVTPAATGKTAKLAVNLTTFPGRLYALAPAPLAAPKLATAVAQDTLHFRAEVVTEAGQPLAARVPLRVRLLSGTAVVAEVYRGTAVDGKLTGRIPLPASAGDWTLEVTELLGGKGSTARGSAAPPLGEVFAQRPAVEVQREEQLRTLLHEARGALTLLTARANVVTAEQQARLAAALKKHQIELKIAARLPTEPAAGVYLAVGLSGEVSTSTRRGGDLLHIVWSRGLFDSLVSEQMPGPGRGFVTACFSPRGWGEHCVALVGGDAAGLEQTLDAFCRWLQDPARPAPAETAPPELSDAGRPGAVAPVPRLSERVGVRLSGVTVAADGKHLVVTADGYHRNCALVEDQDQQARVVRAARVGQAPAVGSLYVSADGQRFGAAGRTTARHGQGFHLLDAGGGQHVFAAFGDLGRQQHHFAASAAGDVVLAPGTCGVVCWRRDGTFWREAWAVDFWKEFPKLDWPVAAGAERIPQFHAYLPAAADYALVVYGEFSDNGWISSEYPCQAWVAAVNLADGKVRWRVDVPVRKTLLFPTLHTSPDGAKLLLQVQLGREEDQLYRFFSIAGGQIAAAWDVRGTPRAVAVSGQTGSSASASRDRLLSVRQADGRRLLERTWPSQPVSVAFAADGRGVYVADDAGRLTALDAGGNEVWHAELGCVSSLAVHGDRVWAAGWDGRLRAFAADGKPRWTLDCTPALVAPNPLALVAESAKLPFGSLVQAKRAPTTAATVPAGRNLLRTGQATLTVGGTSSWMSSGTVQVKAEQLTNGKADDVTAPWLSVGEQFWAATSGRQAWAEIAFAAPTDVQSLTVHENRTHPAAWPAEAVVQVWDEAAQQWQTAARGTFLNGAVNTYALNLKKVSRLRYVPWNSYYRNFYTSEIEVR